VNQTIPCYASTRHLHSVVLERQKVGGWDIIEIILLSLSSAYALIVLLSVVDDMAHYWRVYKSFKSASVGGGSGDIESGMRVSLDSHMTAVESDLVVDDGKEIR
jgi:hypothetical protein